MKIGRNDPCPCGSGRKYKKCCLAKDEIQAREKQLREEAAMSEFRPELEFDSPAEEPSESHAPPLLAASEPRQPRDPAEAAIDARWEQFKTADYEGQIALFEQTLGEPEIIASLALEMLEALVRPTAQRDERARLVNLIQALRDRAPDVYREYHGACVSWQVEAALAGGGLDAASPLADELADALAGDMDGVYRLMLALAYHGQLPFLLAAMGKAWPRVRGSKDLLPWAIDEYQDRACRYDIYEYLERHPQMNGSEEELREKIRDYVDPDGEDVRRFVDRLLRPSLRQYRLDEFNLAPPRRRSRPQDDDDDAPQEAPQPGRMALADLTAEFQLALRRRGMPMARADMARMTLFEYLVERAAGELNDPRSPMERMLRGDKARPPAPRIANALCPDRATLDMFLASLMKFMAWRYHEAAAVMEATPDWLEFLENKGLLDPTLRQRTAAALASVASSVGHIMSQQTNDPALHHAMDDWAQRAGVAGAEARRRGLPDSHERKGGA